MRIKISRGPPPFRGLTAEGAPHKRPAPRIRGRGAPMTPAPMKLAAWSLRLATQLFENVKQDAPLVEESDLVLRIKPADEGYFVLDYTLGCA
jgi:hypothetical protein